MVEWGGYCVALDVVAQIAIDKCVIYRQNLLVGWCWPGHTLLATIVTICTRLGNGAVVWVRVRYLKKSKFGTVAEAAFLVGFNMPLNFAGSHNASVAGAAYGADTAVVITTISQQRQFYKFVGVVATAAIAFQGCGLMILGFANSDDTIMAVATSIKNFVVIKVYIFVKA